MSMLAEPRSRQKWSDDPRNTRWVNDKSKFGYTMLTKMGWSEGKGLGQSLNGETAHIRVKKRQNNAGVGLKKASDDDWISHQDDFNALLSRLNGGNTESKVTSLEAKVRSSRKKILYTKFVKSKDLSNASQQDMAAIFGTRSAPATPQRSDDESDAASVASCPQVDATHVVEHGVETVHTGVNIQDYFARKLAAIKAKTEILNNVENNQCEKTVTENNEHTESKSEDDIDEKRKKTKKKKKSREKPDVGEESKSSDQTSPSEDNAECKIGEECSKKKKKKLKRKSEQCVEELVGDCDNDDLKLKKKKKKSSKEESSIEDIECTEEDSFVKKKKKNRKDETPIIECEAKLSKDKKRKKLSTNSSLSESEDVQVSSKKKKKKKKE